MANNKKIITSQNIDKFVKIYDLGEDCECYDRYTIIYLKEKPSPDSYMFLGASQYMGFSQHGEIQKKHIGAHLGKKIKFDQLPEKVQKYVLGDIN